MDRISQLPDELLLRILSLLPTTKDVVPTMVLSKRWKFLWMFVPRLVYDDSYHSPEYARFSRFVDGSLFMHNAPVVETLRFRLGRICGSADIQVWIRAAHKCRVRELIIKINTYYSHSPMLLPRNLYSCCRMLVTLRLHNGILVDDVFSPASFPSLRKLSLISMKYPGDEFVKRFLSSCPVLEDFVVKRDLSDSVSTFNVIVPSLKSLVVHRTYDTHVAGDYGFVINAPSLELLDVFDDTNSLFELRSDMPKIVEAKVVISCDHPEQIMGAITSVKRLRLCIKDAYPVGSIFNCLVSLNICTCEIEWLNLLMHVLRDSPKLQALKFEKCCGPEAEGDEPRQCWIEPSTVPEGVLKSLETLEWVKYIGTEEEKEVVAFILRNGSCLKKVIIKPESTSNLKKLRMSKELSFLPRRSPTCRLAFD